ncbi:MAG: RNA polymerase sigma factor FliA [Sinobacteraceae bacterium]|nr:RNA polymerase sigma factor FliA [Nevskiaceae bacterium]MCP5339099.1 RNA polymerase sigma factor FliA [Nevskiaceae bacterium]MCP5360008.1 RNA polymerase sigma factor FliA [Nevskiaceae bacterium]MCP5466938.1 RNA polymerase sigma factor FliA [Nevskiaceae bacterium]MCP5472172.1 RNA polymerase sigma factor FliA [Nevskiaceae bacterium]
MSPVRAYAAGAAQASDADRLVIRHAELVKRIAYHLVGRLPPSVDVDDLIQAGMLGLLEAAQHFTTGRGASFETYAGIRIRGAMIDALRKLDWAPRSVHRKARGVAQAIHDIERETGGEARDIDVAARMGLSIDEYHRIVQDSASCQLASLDDDHAAEYGDESLDPFRETVDERFRRALADAIQDLPERERLVMSLYYQDELNLKEIGLVLKVTESRVCQLHGQAVARLKARLADWRDRMDGAQRMAGRA